MQRKVPGNVGLGRIGMNKAKRLLRAGHRVYAYNCTREKLNILPGSAQRPFGILERQLR